MPAARLLAAVLFGLLLATTAAAQPTGPIVSNGAPATAAATDADIKALIDAIENEQSRAELISRLKALESASEPAPESDLIGEVLDNLDTEVTRRFDLVRQSLQGLRSSLDELPVLTSWFWSQVAEPISRAMWYSIGSQIGGAVLAGYVASLAIRALVRGWRDRRLDLPVAAKRKRRLGASLAHLAVNLAALAAFLIVTYLVLGQTQVTLLGRRVAGDLLLAVAVGRTITSLSRALLAPENPRRRLPGLDDATAGETHRWVCLLFGLGVYGYFFLAAARRLGLPWTVHAFLLHLLFFVVAVLAIWAIYRLRAHLGAAIEKWGSEFSPFFSRYLPWDYFSSVGHHILALWVALVYLLWAIGSPEGARLLTSGLLVTILVLIVGRAINVWLDWLLVRQPAGAENSPAGSETEQEPLPTLTVAGITVAKLGVLVVGLAVIAQAWGIDAAGWLTGDAGLAIAAIAGRIALVIGIVLALGKSVDAIAGRYLAARDSGGNLLYSNRTRTMVSMARNLMVTLLITVGIIEVLSAVGVNANALLAGAGVVGLAIGFGAQTLVKDLITGLFILLGDTVRVGDVVDLGGRSGVVEAISMRTVTLRAYNGDVHTIPFSSIDVVTNMTKEFSYYVFDLVVTYKEDLDRVMEVLREIDSQLRREWPYRRLMLEPLEIAGVDAFSQSGPIIKARTKVRAGE
ncbi:MAG: mechanosensitive ion channel domain-containing protein, partial [Geminicoccaceae bacterium]